MSTVPTERKRRNQIKIDMMNLIHRACWLNQFMEHLTKKKYKKKKRKKKFNGFDTERRPLSHSAVAPVAFLWWWWFCCCFVLALLGTNWQRCRVNHWESLQAFRNRFSTTFNSIKLDRLVSSVNLISNLSLLSIHYLLFTLDCFFNGFQINELTVDIVNNFPSNVLWERQWFQFDFNI